MEFNIGHTMTDKLDGLKYEIDEKIRYILNELEITGGMLTGKMIEEMIFKNKITISEYDRKRLNPNSYNLRLDKTLKVYDRRRKFFGLFGPREPLDLHKATPTKTIEIPEEGLVLQPGVLYLGSTVESTNGGDFIMMIDGRSSTGRSGLSVHITAGFGDIGFNGKWTLEITVEEPLRIYPNDEVCQICFFKPYGDTSYKYKGRYQGQSDATPSKFYEEKTKESYFNG